MIQNIKTYINNKYPDRISKCNAIGRLLRYTMLISIVLRIVSLDSTFLYDGKNPSVLHLLGYLDVRISYFMRYSIIIYLLVIPIISVVQFIDRKKNKEKYQISINLFLWVIMLLITLFFMMLDSFETQCKQNCKEEHLSTNCNDYCS